MRVFWRFLTRPVVPVADAALVVTAVVTGDAFHLYLRTPWWAVLAVAWGGTILFAFGAGFARGFGRSVLHDWRQRRAGRDAR